MPTVADLHHAQSRYARHYAQRLHALNALYEVGGTHMVRALSLFDEEWGQIRQAQNWARMHLDQYEAAMELCINFAQKGARVLKIRQSPEQRIAWLEAGLRAAQKVENHEAQVAQLMHLGEVYQDTSELEKAAQHYHEALVLAQQMGDQHNTAALHLALGLLAYDRRALEAGKAYLEKALAAYQSLGGHSDDLAHVLNGLGFIAHDQGEYEEARGWLQQSYDILVKGGNLSRLGIALTGMGMVASVLGDHTEADRIYREALALCESIQDRPGIGIAHNRLGRALQAMGRLSEAKQAYEAGLAIFREMQEPWGTAFSLSNLGQAIYEEGKYEAAHTYFTEALHYCEQISDPMGVAVCSGKLGTIERMLGNYDQAYQYLREALQITVDLGAVPFTLEMLIGIAWLLAAQQQAGYARNIAQVVLNHPASRSAEKDACRALLNGLDTALEAEKDHRGSTENLDALVNQVLNST